VKNTWNIKDLLDLHHFMQVDEDVRRREGEEALAKRDRHIYLAKIKPRLDAAGHFPPACWRGNGWLSDVCSTHGKQIMHPNPCPETCGRSFPVSANG
jgi:hypothetical protein